MQRKALSLKSKASWSRVSLGRAWGTLNPPSSRAVTGLEFPQTPFPCKERLRAAGAGATRVLTEHRKGKKTTWNSKEAKVVTPRLMQPGQVISISLAGLLPWERILQALSSGHSWKKEMGAFH